MQTRESSVRVRVQLTAPLFSQSDLAAARDRFYPNWWIHKVSGDRPAVTDRPSYWVTCRNDTERELALASKPHFLDVYITVAGRDRH